MKPRPVPEKAVLLGKDLIIADLHIGFERSMAREGNYVPSLLDRLIGEVLTVVRRERPKRLIINGDLKHSFVPFRMEREELGRFFDALEGEVGEITVVRGNHDPGILWLRERGVEIVDRLEVGRWTLVHGHRLEEGERFIIGHEHPAIRLRDEVGASVKVPAFLWSERLIVLPAFSPWAYGNDVTREIVSPFLRKFDSSKLRVLVPVEGELLDFGELGRLTEVLKGLGPV
ncbi:metallophosphoesterase [Thermococcus sp. 18S1]|uniref:metallophosphoesterase n=1 Tax=Thermococcus sp. 18S1 TaxID=1638210 RepID=UPI001438E257|nr:metallophosphoesterase [Thermococcus sp. 18S1]NJE30370.1 metallophosphoesterase [Thermococcus sp. 18S1]